MIRILVVDDQDLIRKGMALLLGKQPDIEVLGMAADGEEAIAQTDALTPELILMDIKMPKMNGIDATQIITAKHPKIKILVLTTFDTDELVFDAIRAGAHGYLLKGITVEALAAAIRGVMRGESQLDAYVATKVLQEFRRVKTTPPSRPAQGASALADAPLILEQLTERELEILSLIAQGLNNKEICERLFLGEGTVRNYVSNVLSKLHANDRTQALVTAVRHGIVQIR